MKCSGIRPGSANGAIFTERTVGKKPLAGTHKRLAALGEIAAGMAHEIRNPLGGIQLCASMLGIDLREQPASLELVGKISTGVKRLEALVSQVLHFTREIQARPAAAIWLPWWMSRGIGLGSHERKCRAQLSSAVRAQ